MVKCRNCKWMIGYDIMSDCYICGATNDIDYIDPAWAEDNDLGCDLFVDNSNDDTTKRA